VDGNVVSGANNHGIVIDFNNSVNGDVGAYISITNNVSRGNVQDGFNFTGNLPYSQAHWVISHNQSIQNGRHGYTFNTSPQEVTFDFNKAIGNTQFGAALANIPSGVLWDNNTLWNNTAGELTFFNAMAPLLTSSPGPIIATSSTAGAGDTAFVNTFNLAQGASGTVTVRAYDGNNPGSSWAVKVYTITWDKTTLVQTTISTDTNGNLTANALQMSGSILQVKATAGIAMPNIIFDVQFKGSIMRRS
jgi:hypothetical protein